MKSWIHYTNKKRIVGSDTDRITAIQSYIGRGYSSAQYQTIPTPNGTHHQRRPDLTIQMCGQTVPIELDGGIHGYNDELTESPQTKQRNNDYVREGYIPIIINHEQLKAEGISEDVFVKCAIILLEPIFRTKQRLQQEESP